MRKIVDILKPLSLFILIGFLITSCKNEEDIDVNKISLDIQFSRMEQELFQSELPMEEKVPQLAAKYNSFFTRFCENIIKVGSIEDPELVGSLKNFVYDSDIRNIQQKVIHEYNDLSQEESEFKNGLKRYHHYFPDKTIPKIITFISGFNYAVVVTDSAMGIGLDMFMGPEFSYYEMLRFPQYRRNRLDRAYLVKDGLRGWFESEFEMNTDDKSFLNEILHKGKILYLLQKCLPDYPPYRIIGYSPNQWKWCVENEANIWTFFVGEKTFYSTSFTKYHKFINEGPFTSGFDRTSPDQTGYYMGWKIIESYMENNPRVTIKQLFEIKDPKIILNKSGYKPKK